MAAQGQPFGHAIDMWSLGVSVAELFAGRTLVQAREEPSPRPSPAPLAPRPSPLAPPPSPLHPTLPRCARQAASRGGLAVQVAQLLGRPPHGAFAQSKYASELLPLVQHTPEALSRAELRRKLATELGAGPSQQAPPPPPLPPRPGSPASAPTPFGGGEAAAVAAPPLAAALSRASARPRHLCRSTS